MNDKLKEILLKYRKIDPITGCWLWTNYCQESGHGRVWYNGKNYFVHRISYEEFVGPLKNYCLHKRECPNPNCFNPDHLYDGTKSDNSKDYFSINNIDGFGAALERRNRDHCNKGHKYPKNVKIHRGGRVCNECQRIRNKERYLKNRQQK